MQGLKSKKLQEMQTRTKSGIRKANRTGLIVIGWREWINLPDLGGAWIKAKVDTGARTSALHAWNIQTIEKNGQNTVTFDLHPLQRDMKHTLHCKAQLIDRREIRSSSGEAQDRYIIQTVARMGDFSWLIELSLTRRDEMGFRMLLGRTAMRGRFVVNPGKSYMMGKR